MKIKCRQYVAGFFVFVTVAFLWNPLANANLKELKAYQEAFPDAKLKCTNCHAVERPSKTGSHELNDYGNAALQAEKDPTAGTFKKLGKAEDFKKA